MNFYPALLLQKAGFFILRGEETGMKKRLGFIGIIVENRRVNAPRINELLSDYGEIIVARMGVPYKEKNCSVIILIVNANTDQMGSLTGKLGKLPGVSIKSALSKAG